MPLSILIPLVVIGVLLVTIALRLFLPGSTRTIADPTAAWLREQPDHPVARHLLDDLGQTALIIPQTGPPGLVWLMGEDTTSRPLNKPAITQVPSGLRIATGDFAAPTVTATLADTREWMAELKNA